jgi:oxygen-independent coproporphyrinogen-3 oxidase
MRRIHNSEQAFRSVGDAHQAGFGNISIDLIYGIPGQSKGTWEKNLEIALTLGVQHFSAYHLTYEPGTILNHWKKKGRISPINEDESMHQFMTLINFAVQKGYEHYEISNFALNGFQSRHNSSYWQQENYLGIGPSAHSYNGISRRWNLSNNKKYIDNMNSGVEYFETESLTPDDLYNEFVMTSLRTSKGINTIKLKEQFGEEKVSYFVASIQKFVDSGYVSSKQGIYRLEGNGIFIADHIISEVFV